MGLVHELVLNVSSLGRFEAYFLVLGFREGDFEGEETVLIAVGFEVDI